MVLFAYARPALLARALDCLRENRVPLIYAFADGAKGPADTAAVAAIRAQLRGVDWCELRLTERAGNLGLGRSVLAGVTEVAARHEAFLVWEDDLICVPGTYAWMSAALRHYADDVRVMSVSGWTHPRIVPADAGREPYFDGRADCWVWGTWSRAWRGMGNETALEKLAAARRSGVHPDAYGTDLPVMARQEATRNTWAVRWLYHHMQHGGLCLRPPWSMVEHIGFDEATNAAEAWEWINPPLRPVPPIPAAWPAPRVHPECRGLWRRANPPALFWARCRRRLKRDLELFARHMVPRPVRRWLASRWQDIRWEGDYAGWPEARRAAGGYDQERILQRSIRALRKVRAGGARYEQDGVAFHAPPGGWPAMTAIRAQAAQSDGRLGLVDFGGALGSLYYKYKTVWDGIADVRWQVIEQPHYVAAGQREFADGRLTFHVQAEAAAVARTSDVLLLSSVLQYLEQPHENLDALLAHRFALVVLDRTPLITRGRDRLTVQQVPPAVGRASYPCWHFDRDRLLAHFAADYDLQLEFPGADGALGGAIYRGFVFRRRAGAVAAPRRLPA